MDATPEWATVRTTRADIGPVAELDALGAVWSPDFDAYAEGRVGASQVRCVLCTHAPCDCPEFGTAEYFALVDALHGKGKGRKGEVVVPLVGGRRTEVSTNSGLTSAECRARGVCETCGGPGSLGFVGISAPVEGRVSCPDCRPGAATGEARS